MVDFVQVSGLRAIDDQLAGLSPAVGAKAVRIAQRAALVPIQRAAKAGYRAIADTGNLARQVRIRFRRSSLRSSVGFFWRRNLKAEQIAKHAERGTREPYYARFVELGFTHTSGKAVAGRGILRRAFDGQERATLITLRDSYGAAIDKAVGR